MASAQIPVDAPKGRVFASIQHLRGVAASLVVLYHSTEGYPNAWLARFGFGESGVAIFFMISGFIIWTSSRRETARQFATRRLIRIVPMYWLVTGVVLALGVHSWAKPIFAPWAILRSTLFIPYFATAQQVMPFPVLVPGWTLNFEMLFYGLFAIGMASGRPLLLTIAAMGSLFVIGQWYHFTIAPLVLYTNWLSILFVAGLIIGACAPADRRVAMLWPVGVPLIAGFCFLPLPRVALAGGVILLIAGVTAQERVRGWPQLRALAALGNASYAIYLVHMPVSFVLSFALTKLYPGILPWPILALLCVGCSWATGLLAHRVIEKPLGKRLRQAVEPAFARVAVDSA